MRWFSFTAVIIYKVTTNNELAKSEPKFQVEIRGILSAAGPNISVNQSVHSLVLCALLFETVNTELTVNSPVTQA